MWLHAKSVYVPSHRLRDVLWDNCRLYLIMDFVELDLREHMDQNPESSDPENVKVGSNSVCHTANIEPPHLLYSDRAHWH
jgi:hypothetical protein